jgi:AraC family transcriptional regulator of adaptative response / methylphosphotriester-DNA alkyltransferase methyltransferase
MIEWIVATKGERKLTYDEMWTATVNSDKNCDGAFFYVVKTVGVYCRPSCKSRTPLRKNVSFFETSADAQNAGYRPCKRCQPDLPHFEPAEDLAKKAKDLIDNAKGNEENLTQMVAQLGVSASHLSFIFKQRYKMSPLHYLNEVRLQKAKTLLSETDMPILDVAGEVGYESLSAFYRLFKKYTGMAPKAYRLKGGDNLETRMVL